MRASLLIASTLLCAAQAQADWHASSRVSIESQSYETTYLADDYAAPAFGFTTYSDDGLFFDLEYLLHDEEPEQAEEGIALREEVAFTGGYRLKNGIIVFAGWKFGHTSGFDSDLEEWDIQESGAFGGLSYNFAFSPSSSITVAAAAAAMNGTVELIKSNNDSSGELTGAAFGVSSSVAWNYALASSVTTSIGAKYQSYSFDNAIDTETITSLFGKLVYRFN